MTALHSPRLVVFAKAPQSGVVKTRLIPALGAEGAAALAQRMLAHVLQQALQSGAGPVELCMSPPPGDPAWDHIDIPAAVLRTCQGEGDLGERMARVVRRVTAEAVQPVLLMGSDCPALTAAVIQQAACQLQAHGALLVPVADGGYVMIGLKSPCPTLFDQMPWSTASVAAETLLRMAALGLSVWRGPLLHDIDEPADLAQLPAGFLGP
ncbi:Glycosyltransferase [Polaromonas sp. CG9_12]|uniref:TIGR04282 family arsenosugar biosynthesis glycosyltransferase n=1 Tax=Polaromonas sp. CG_9.11 TaxID=2787730 RepID=UPI0004DDD9A6|nr:TIGR04282 family arsenosugar biosynthesis glycosyltransferase [Polaromonas sp. CG_9.11]MBG6074366.1 rSAM/selenodomain-associated transferase 1 [Polaromonas sp. CG_9.11]CDS54500.1 Glycosyltransferase [Polaromonas sp. CG9_12]